MKKLILAACVVLAGGLLAFGWTFTPQKLAAPSTEGTTLPPLPSTTVRIAVAETGSMDSMAMFAYRGGNFEPRTFGMDSFVVRHPTGVVLFEAGFGKDLAEHVKVVPWLMQSLTKVHAGPLLADQLAAVGLIPKDISGIFLTHAHWDHVGAIPDLPGVPVFVDAAERQFIESGGNATKLIRSFSNVQYHVYEFTDPPYAGFSASYDVFHDGSVVIVPADGHTPGAIIAFVRTPDHDYALIGDQAWQREGVDIPAERPWLSRLMVDENPEGVRANLIQLHELQVANPRLVVVPSHDRRTTQQMPRLSALFPERSH